MRRYPAGVNRRFDDTVNDTDELVRLAQRGHVFSAGGERSFTDNSNRAPMRGPSEPQQEPVMKKITIKAPKAVKPVAKKPAKAAVEKNTDALEAPHKLKPHHYRYK